MSTTIFDWTPESRPRLWSAWREMAILLEDREWHHRDELLARVDAFFQEDAHLKPQRSTLLALLATAGRRGVLERRPRDPKKSKRGATKFRLAKL